MTAAFKGHVLVLCATSYVSISLTPPTSDCHKPVDVCS